jgi:hypothetical protein
MILLVFNGRRFGHYSFDLAGFADKIYQRREAPERRNLDATTFTERSPAISNPISLHSQYLGLDVQSSAIDCIYPPGVYYMF